MRIAGIIMECNPFHEGHDYIIKTARSLTGASFCIVVLSGDYVQRGEPAVLDKESRTEKVLEAGADLVLELPSCYSTGAADYFARGAVTLLKKLGAVTDLVFGSESSDTDRLMETAQFLLREDDTLSIAVKRLMSDGLTYPAARSLAAKELGLNVPYPDTPNDILAVEYCKQLLTKDGSLSASGIVPHAASRIACPSASSLRKKMHDVRGDFSAPLYYALWCSTALQDDACLSVFQGVSGDLSRRIIHNLPQFTDYASFCSLIKTRNLTYTAVSRALLHILLDMRSEHLEEYITAGVAGYARVLGFRRESSALLGILANASQIPLIIRPGSDIEKVRTPFGRMLLQDCRVSELYDSIAGNKKTGRQVVPELSKQPVILC